MVLADTLALAAREKPELIVDFATLTGACVNALTERYSGAFTNRPEWHATLELRRPRQRRARVAVSDGRGLRQRPRIVHRRRPAMHARQQGRPHPRGALSEPLRAGADSLDPHRPGRQQSQRRARPRSDRFHRLRRAIYTHCCSITTWLRERAGRQTGKLATGKLARAAGRRSVSGRLLFSVRPAALSQLATRSPNHDET